MINNVIICDTTCLIALERIQSLEILKQTFPSICTTPEIRDEFGSHLPEWIAIRKVTNKEVQLVIEKILDKGEASAIALTLETPDSVLIIDEKKGRSIAKDYNINIIGTLKLLLIAKQKQIITLVKPLIEQLEKQGFRFSTQVRGAVLNEANESD